ncbi:MAG TPA: hypothetical protein VLP30_01275, partial [Desulfatirhabdiaceae bacterium]|nr:hypothetical protein [Desulfatirhabdiaceae bacterium]
LVKVKADENFNRRKIWNISRIEFFTQRRDWPKWSVLKPAPSENSFHKVAGRDRHIAADALKNCGHPRPITQ